MVGEGLRGFLEGGRRGELFITSKIWNDEHRPALLRRGEGRPCAGRLSGCITAACCTHERRQGCRLELGLL